VKQPLGGVKLSHIQWSEAQMNLKQMAARHALDAVRNDMLLGLGSGTTTDYFLDLLGERIQAGDLHGIRGIPTSEATAARARKWGIQLVTLAECWQTGRPPFIDLAVDGADEVDPALNLIKGLGKALLREKIIVMHARRFLVIIDESKRVARLGTRGPLPVELIQFEAAAHVAWLNTLGCRSELWLEADGRPVVTDNGNYLARCWFDEGIADAYAFARQLAARPGIVEHGLFLDLATGVVVAGDSGIKTLRIAELEQEPI
jgi:ribose 5-phosphate isomerase A